jgi:hypothetical protein
MDYLKLREILLPVNIMQNRKALFEFFGFSTSIKVLVRIKKSKLSRKLRYSPHKLNHPSDKI